MRYRQASSPSRRQAPPPLGRQPANEWAWSMKRGGLNDLLFRCGRVREPGAGPGKCCSLALARGWAGEAGDQASSGAREPSLFPVVAVGVLLHRRRGRVRVRLRGGMSTLRKVKTATRVSRGGVDAGSLLIGARKRAHGKLIKPSAACLMSKRAAGDTYSTAGGFIRASSGARC